MTTATIVSIILVVFYIFSRSQQQGGVKKLFESSRNAPQYWGSFILLMGGVLLITYILIKL